jgi:hypothetical protein
LSLLLLRPQALLVLNELLLHEKEVLDTFQLKQPELALGRGLDLRQLRRSLRTLPLFLLLANAGRRRGLELFLLLLLALLQTT